MASLPELVSALGERMRTNRLKAFYGFRHDVDGYGVYDWAQGFHNAGSKYTQRCVMGGNRTGKSFTVGAEIACHAIGWYPDWWEGLRLDTASPILVAGETSETTRDICQTQLLGNIDENRNADGTGWIPKEAIHRLKFRSSSVTNVVEEAKIAHASNKYSVIKFKGYNQGHNSFQGTSYKLAWLDEEPEDSADQNMIFGEVLARLLDQDGSLLFSRTPLFGMTSIIKHFMGDKNPYTYYVAPSLYQIHHISKEKRDEMVLSYPEHERETRVYGKPMIGEGAIFPVDPKELKIKPFEIPDYFRRVCGIDFGFNHPAAGCWIAHDADTDVVYVYDCYSQSNWTPAQHRAAIVSRGDWIPVAWPHDGMNVERSGGEKIITQYDLPNALGISSRYDDDSGGAQRVEPMINEMVQRMKTGRFKVFDSPAMEPFWTEFRMYHRKDGKIVKKNDDVLDSCRSAMMMLRYATTKSETGYRQRTTGHKKTPLGKFLGRR